MSWSTGKIPKDLEHSLSVDGPLAKHLGEKLDTIATNTKSLGEKMDTNTKSLGEKMDTNTKSLGEKLDDITSILLRISDNLKSTKSH